MRTDRARSSAAIAVALALLVAGCHKKPPVANAPPPAASPAPFPSTGGPASPGPPPEVPRVAPNAPVAANSLLPWNDRSVDEINGPNSPLKPAFFAYDKDDLDEAAKRALSDDAEVLRTYKTWVITVEGHCDERGTAEYNLALGDRRALAARSYLVSLGIPADRIRTVSYGSEFPFDTGHDETAFKRNRRAHLMLTSK